MSSHGEPRRGLGRTPFDRFTRAWMIDYLHSLATSPERPLVAFLGCECGACEHVTEGHAEALVIADETAHTDCDCDPWSVDGAVAHEHDCPMAEPPSSGRYVLTAIGAGRIVLRDLGMWERPTP